MQWCAQQEHSLLKAKVIISTIKPGHHTIRLIRDGEKGERGEEGDMEVGEEGGYTYRYTVTSRMTPALSWAAIRAILMFH